VAVWRALGPELLRRYPAELGHVLWILLYSGLRVGDVCTLTRAQVAQAATGATVEVRSKGRSGEHQRTFRPIDEVLPRLAWLSGRPGWSQVWQCVSSPGGKGAAGDPDRAAAILRRVLPSPYEPHDFRRAFATYQYAGGKDLKTIAQMGGWESAASVERYIVLVPEERIDQARKDLSNLLFPRPNQPTIPTRPPVRPNR
jgi:integrase